jgi:hypothetical protein
MTLDVTETAFSALILVAGLLVAKHWMDRWTEMRLTIFKPYRGDPWPQGVQEEDGVRFRLTAARGRETRQDEPADPPSDAEIIPVGRIGTVQVGRPRRDS